MSPLYLILHVALLCAGVGGLLLLVRGLRGHRAGDHPHCRSCNYDLIGAATASTPHAAKIGPGTGTCPECGADLAKISAVRIGEHRRRPRTTVAGLVLLFLFAVVGGTEVWSAGRNVNLNPYKPFWLLRWEASRGSKAVAALVELQARLKNKTLSQGQVDEITHDALALQGDASRPWLPEWGDVVEQAHTIRMLSQDDWRTYARQALILNLSLRPKVRRGDPIPSWIVAGHRGGSGLLPGPLVSVFLGAMKVDGRPALRSPRIMGSVLFWTSLAGGGGASQTLEWSGLADPAPAEGEHEWGMTVPVVVHDGPSQQSPVLLRLSMPIKARAMIAPASEATVRPIHDESQRAAVEKSLRVFDIGMQTRGWLLMSIQVHLPPVPLAFDAWLQQGERRWRLGAVQFAAGRTNARGVVANVGELAGDRVDVILRPSADAAARSLDLTQYWDGEVIIKDVVIKDVTPPTATTAPARRAGAGGRWYYALSRMKIGQGRTQPYRAGGFELAIGYDGCAFQPGSRL